jgi:hypothetical protein
VKDNANTFDPDEDIKRRLKELKERGILNLITELYDKLNT